MPDRDAERLRRTTSRPGQVVWMPRRSTWLNRDKPRPFAVVAAAPGAHQPVTLAYGSSQVTEGQFGAMRVRVTPAGAGINRNGLRTATYFYPGTLLVKDVEEVPGAAGFLGGALSPLRIALRAALGIGQGSCLSPGALPGSRRGRIVELIPPFRRFLGTTNAVLLTEPMYSRRERYQLIVPIIPRRPPRAGPYDLLLSRDWLKALGMNAGSAVLPIPLAQSIWHEEDVVRETEHVLDEAILDEIDRRLCAYFSLPEPNAED